VPIKVLGDHGFEVEEQAAAVQGHHRVAPRHRFLGYRMG